MNENVLYTLESLMRGIHQFGGFLSTLTLLAMLLVGLLECFLGYRMMKAAFAICGFFLGFTLGALVLGLMLDENANQTLWMVLSVLCGIGGGFLLFRMYLVGIFLTNGTLAMLVFLLMMGRMYGSSLTISIIGGIVVGVLSVKFVRPWVIATTGISGALTAGTALAGLFRIDSGLVALIFAVILAILGIGYQWKTTDRNYRKARKAGAARTIAVPAGTPASRTASAMSASVPMTRPAAPMAPAAQTAASTEEIPEFLKRAAEEMH